MVFNCPLCDYSTNRGYNLKRHTIRNHPDAPEDEQEKLHIFGTNCPKSVTFCPKSVTSCPKSVTSCPENVTHVDTPFSCESCGISFSRKYHLKRHLTTCTGEKTDKLNKCSNCDRVFGCRMSLHRHKKAGCAGPAPATQYVTNNNITNNNNNTTNNTTNNNINNTNNNNININIHINNFGNENLDHISVDFAQKCLEMGWHGISPMMDKIFFDPEHPENFNVTLLSLKNSLVNVKADDDWRIRGLIDTIDKMIDKSGTQIISKAAEQIPLEELGNDDNVNNINAIRNIKPEAKRKLRERAKAHLVERREDEVID